MPPQLLALTEGPNIVLDKPILLLGRHQECDIQLASRKVSRRHCCIAQVDDYLVVRDLGSTNGIRINGVRVQEGSLKAGDELTIGNHRYQVKWPDGEAGAEPVKMGKATRSGPVDRDVGSFDDPVPLPEKTRKPSPSASEEPSERNEGDQPRTDESDSLSDLLPPPPPSKPPHKANPAD